ncbi:CRISPR system Cascade subunit CasB [Actinopolymorpha cephalotaxi]|uniref:CRISPR system Cascade subunit CasB n=1 Tax=Actinopolymorpha cephalotaxi TaxID=504797 RepID=A0A1I3CF31_9ACTN|nr:type I-E CRISPR-associated protein Cse2/CasB [Actinopolymorpha cephalotaxi]NYH82080.1 CRISPR system Cascade subunit CasB [Actinopolymorpha cephalotaxi]SFH73023.1 CRISPR system Cascade subunit CasB [Actinopolymorpha cephalotaxi]
MTTTTQAQAEEVPPQPPKPSQPRDLARFVASRVARLQREYLDHRPDAAAALAKLRRGVGKEPGAVPELWQLTLEGVPLPAWYTDAPTDFENAAYAALTLYAVHQQSRREPMHQPGQGLGAAARVLRARKKAAGGSEDAVRRRFEAIGTAVSFSEVMHHGRALVTLLRTHNVPLDYGRLAQDLVLLQRPGRGDQVRLAWGRDFYQAGSEPTDQDNSAATGAVAEDGETTT